MPERGNYHQHPLTRERLNSNPEPPTGGRANGRRWKNKYARGRSLGNKEAQSSPFDGKITPINGIGYITGGLLTTKVKN